MSSDISIHVDSVSKIFPIYERPHHRLLQMLADDEDKGRWYREFLALKDVSFDVRKGETVGIVGRNGSGKSTLLQIICGILTPTRGQLCVVGRIAALLELGAGFNPDFTGRENVFLNGTVVGLSRREIEARFDEIAAFADIGDFIEQPVRAYSSGMYVRLAFAVAIHVTPDILIVDEALAVGDEAFQRKCYSRIERMRNDGATVLFVSHSAAAVLELCNRAILLDHGELLMVGEPKAVVSRYQKLLYAPRELAASIRAEIKGDSPVSVSDQLAATSESLESTLVQTDAYAEAYYDEGLRSQSVECYVSQGAKIRDVCLELLDGRRVNVLKSGEEYLYTYEVDFSRTASSVQFGMLIKTVSGVEIGGAVSAPMHAAVGVVQAGASYRVSFRFRCLLASGTYFLNAGVRGCLDANETYLDRLIDVAMFRVLPKESQMATGIVDFQVSSTIAEIEHAGAGV